MNTQDTRVSEDAISLINKIAAGALNEIVPLARVPYRMLRPTEEFLIHLLLTPKESAERGLDGPRTFLYLSPAELAYGVTNQRKEVDNLHWELVFKYCRRVLDRASGEVLADIGIFSEKNSLDAYFSDLQRDCSSRKVFYHWKTRVFSGKNPVLI